jgi:glycosyltransferase involved in cell wall biosynthesis
MNVLILSTFEHFGGAAIAARRLYESLEKEGVNVTLGFALKDDKSGASSTVLFTSGIRGKARFWAFFILERLRVLIAISNRKWLYKYSFGERGLSILTHPAIQKADVIHLHWVNFGFLSIQEIVKLSSIKKVVWTFHDYWPMTGGCHLPYECRGFETDCGTCFYLKPESKISQKNLFTKATQLADFQGKLVTVSQYMASQARRSPVFKNLFVETIGNPLNTNIFHPINKQPLRAVHHLPQDVCVVLCGAADLDDENKGFRLLLEAIALVKGDFRLLIFGELSDPKVVPEGVTYSTIGKRTGEQALAEVYNLADFFVLPSLQESLSYMTMEAMACGKPVVAFDSGGVRDLVVDGETGFLVPLRDIKTLADKITVLVSDASLRATLGEAARNHVVETYSEHAIAQKYLQLYQTFR